MTAGTPRRYTLAELNLFPGNARRGDVERIRRSLRRFGQYRPVVVNAGTLTGRPLEVLAGNHVVLAARAEGWTEIDGYERDVDHPTAVAINLADNRLPAFGTMDEPAELALATQLDPADADAAGYDVDYVLELRDRVAAPGEVLEDDPGPAPNRDMEPLTRPGDVWTLGEHRLVCGDATDPAAYAALLEPDDVAPRLLWTDPPYGVDYVGKTPQALTIANDALTSTELGALLADSLSLAVGRLAPGSAGDTAGDVEAAGAVERVLGSEPVAFGWKPGAGHQRPPDRRQDTVWEVPRPARSADHPTMKPVALVARALRNHSRHGDLVLDPFAGSGSVMSAAAQLGRRARMIELDPHYCDVIVARWEALGGATATRESSGTSN